MKDTEEWKKFQADLQTAVRVANDFMNGEAFFKFYLQGELNINIKNMMHASISEIFRFNFRIAPHKPNKNIFIG